MYTYSVPANMGAKAGEVLVLEMTMTLLNNSGANRTYAFRVKFGGTTHISNNLIAVPTSTSTRTMLVRVVIFNDGSTNAQSVTATVSISGVLTLEEAPLLAGASRTVNGTIDQTAAQTLAVTLQSDAATATQTITTKNALLTLT
jgi:hypothetical protein